VKCQADIIALAEEKYDDAVCLYNNGRYNAAYYLSGYSVELFIKARICKTLGIEDFFDFENPNKTVVKNDGSLYKPFRTHNLEQLIVLSGIFNNFNDEFETNVDFKTAWSEISAWTEGHRYLSGKSQNQAENILTSIKKFHQWIQKHL
jgi:uncharacterized protein (UPF0332 family)